MATPCTESVEAGWRRLQGKTQLPQCGTHEAMALGTPPCPVPLRALTCHDGFPVPFPIGPDPDEFLPQEGGHIRVAVHEYPDGVLQGDRSQIFDLPSTKTGMLTSLPGGREGGKPVLTPGIFPSPGRRFPQPTSSVIVAEKSIVWRWWEHIRMISFICSSKYSSSILVSREGKESREGG